MCAGSRIERPEWVWFAAVGQVGPWLAGELRLLEDWAVEDLTVTVYSRA